MSIIILIPARLAATRLPNKPLADIHGKPMIVHVMERAKEANIGPVVVACCCESIKNIIEQHGGTAILTNPDHASGTDRIFEALEIFDPEGDFSHIINLQGDLPFIDPQSLQILSRHMIEGDYDMTTLAAPLVDKDDFHNSNVVKIAMTPVPENQCTKAYYFSRSSIPYHASQGYHHIGIYGYKRDALKQFVSASPSILEKDEKLEQLRALELGMQIHAVVMNTVPYSVDTQEDLEKVRHGFLSPL